MLASFFTLQMIGGLFGKIWSGVCTFISTPIGAALLAALIAYNAGVHIERARLNASWQAKWDAAEAQAEQDRLKRDAFMKAKIEADANTRLADLATRKDELERMVNDYARDEAKQPGAAQCLTDESDARWLRDAQRTHAQPKAKRGLAERLRTLGR